jgi:DNA-directed RNA polymerase specialized sigma24 family protein
MHSSRLSRDGREDARLVRECRDGDDRAFETLVLKYQDQVISVVYRMVSDREEAMDISQETFIKAYQGLHTFDAKMPFRAWLLKIGTNAAIDNLRRRGRGRDTPPEPLAGLEARRPFPWESSTRPARRVRYRRTSASRTRLPPWCTLRSGSCRTSTGRSLSSIISRA